MRLKDARNLPGRQCHCRLALPQSQRTLRGFLGPPHHALLMYADVRLDRSPDPGAPNKKRDVLHPYDSHSFHAARTQ